MDAFGHVNHARLVTLLEEARVPLLFNPAADLRDFAKGIVVVRLSVDYRAPVVVNGVDVRVEITLSELRAASFTLDYRLYAGPSEKDGLAATARTTLAPYDVGEGRPRRLTGPERDFLHSLSLRTPGDGAAGA